MRTIGLGVWMGCWVLGGAGCGSSVDPEQWKTAADCSSVKEDVLADECRSRVAVEVFKSGVTEGEALLAQVKDPLVKDYILLTITRELFPSSTDYCRRIQKKELLERCEAFVSRPHLYRTPAPR